MANVTVEDQVLGGILSQQIRRAYRRRWLIALAILAGCGLAGVGWFAYHHESAPIAAAKPPPPADVDVSPPLMRMIARTTEFTGQFSAIDQVDLRAQVSGYVSELHFTDGQIVRKDDLLFVIDPEPYRRSHTREREAVDPTGTTFTSRVSQQAELPPRAYLA